MGVNMANLKIKGAPDNGTGAFVLTVLAVLLSRLLVDTLWTEKYHPRWFHVNWGFY